MALAPIHQPEVDITSAAVNESSASRTVGDVYTHTDGSTYRYVRATSSPGTTIAAGQVGTWVTASTFVVDNNAANANCNQFAGIFLGALTGDYYGWIKTGGRYSAVVTDAGDDITEGDLLTVSDAVDGACDRLSTLTGSYGAWGVALAADSDEDDTVDAWIFGNSK